MIAQRDIQIEKAFSLNLNEFRFIVLKIFKVYIETWMNRNWTLDSSSWFWRAFVGDFMTIFYPGKHHIRGFLEFLLILMVWCW